LSYGGVKFRPRLPEILKSRLQYFIINIVDCTCAALSRCSSD